MEIEDEKIGIISPATLGCRTPDWPCFSLSVDYEPWETARSGDYEQELWQMPGANDIFLAIFKMLQVLRVSRSWISTKKWVINLLGPQSHRCHLCNAYLLPETNIAPENRPLEGDSFWKPLFSGYVCFREGICSML